ncbi:MAG TPA: hypothetical protein VFL91_09145 [Thermomicrobiales bacterium]|nr:hypothetical protein [Thermomicrobiales bacterium]
MEMWRAALRRLRRRGAELVGLLLGVLAGRLLVCLAWPQAAVASDALWLPGVVPRGLAGLVAQAL